MPPTGTLLKCDYQNNVKKVTNNHKKSGKVLSTSKIQLIALIAQNNVETKNK